MHQLLMAEMQVIEIQYMATDFAKLPILLYCTLFAVLCSLCLD